MNWLFKAIDLPLLGKELLEQAAQRRMYVYRTLYACALFALFLINLNNEIARSTGQVYMVLGIGRRVFQSVVGIQYVAIYMLMPALTSGVITIEKENRTLELLFASSLTPRWIVIQKLLGRVALIATYLLASLPVVAVSYAFGGISAREVVLNTVVLVITAVQVGAFSVLISTRTRTSGEALMATYTYGILFSLAAAIVLGLATLLFQGVSGGLLGFIPVGLLLGLFPPTILTFSEMSLHPIALYALVCAVGWIMVFVVLAEKALVSHAFLKPKKRKPGLFATLITGGERSWRRSRRVRDEDMLNPGEPIVWREVYGSLLGRPRHFVLTVLMIEAPVFLIAFQATLGQKGPYPEIIAATVKVVWFMAALVVTGRSVDSVSQERAGQTLEVLLTTPLSGADIVRQKARMSFKLSIFFAVPLVTLYLFGAICRATSSRQYSEYELGALGYLLASILWTAALLSAYAWVARWIGLKIKLRRRAVAVALLTVVGWNVLPGALRDALRWYIGRALGEWALVLSPGSIVRLIESLGDAGYSREFRGVPIVIPIAAAILIHGTIAVLFRSFCLRNADRYLGRIGPDDAKKARAAAATT